MHGNFIKIVVGTTSLKHQQWLQFVGGTICYTFMQAVGIVDDQTMDCWKKKS